MIQGAQLRLVRWDAWDVRGAFQDPNHKNGHMDNRHGMIMHCAIRVDTNNPIFASQPSNRVTRSPRLKFGIPASNKDTFCYALVLDNPSKENKMTDVEKMALTSTK